MPDPLEETILIFEALVDDRPMRVELPRGVWLHCLLLVQLSLIHPALSSSTRQKGRALIEAVRRRMAEPVRRWIDRSGRPVQSARATFQYTTPSEFPWGSTRN